MRVVFGFLLLVLSAISVQSDIVIRPSDHVLAGANYETRRVAEFVHENDIDVKTDRPIKMYHIVHPGDVAIDANFELDHWGVVDFKPVPKFSIDTHDPVLQDTFISGSVHSGKEPWDVYVWNALVSVLTKKDKDYVVVDVGANLGYFSLAAASLGARVIAFEPMSRNARKLSKSIQKNHFNDAITLFQNAVWDNSPSFPVRLTPTSPSNQGNGQAVEDAVVGAAGLYGIDYVNTVSLSEVVHSDVDVMKIDTEGTEGAVIAGAKGLICDYRVKYILMEFTEIKTRTGRFSAPEMLLFLDSVGYTVSDVVAGSPVLNIADFQSFPPNILFTLEGESAKC